jgi:Mor family transcriptional regulator
MHRPINQNFVEIRLEDLTGTMGEIAQIIGLTSALLLAENLGGRAYKIKLNGGSTAFDPVRELLGQEVVDRLAFHFPMKLYIPMANDAWIRARDRQIIEEIEQGATKLEVGRRYLISEQDLYKLVNRLDLTCLSEDEVLGLLPRSFVHEVAHIVSVDGILWLIDNFGGDVVYIADKKENIERKFHGLKQNEITAMRKEMRTSYLDVPRAAKLKRFLRNKMIVDMRNSKMTHASIAKALNTTPRHVRRILKSVGLTSKPKGNVSET